MRQPETQPASFSGRAAVLFGLNAVACAWPLLELLARHPTFFVAGRWQPGEVVGLVFGLFLLPPLIVAATSRLLGRISARLATGLHRTAIVLLTALFLLQLLGRVPLTTEPAVAIAAAGGFAVAVLNARWRPLRTFLIFVGIASLALPAFLLLATPLSDLARAARDLPDLAAAGDIRPIPVVMVVFDELPVVALMDADERIDSARFPAFGRLAATSTWYRNATTVSEQTTHAVPAILTGLRPPVSDYPIPNVEHFPVNLFTLLAGSHRLNVHESVTRLCPPGPGCHSAVDADPLRLATRARDLAVVYAHLVTPAELSGRLPEVGGRWGGFGHDGKTTPSAKERRHHDRVALDRRQALFHRFIRSVPGEKGAATLHFLHVLLPHAPYMCMPSGNVYAHHENPASKGGRWVEDSFAVIQAHQRQLLQTGCADHRLGELFARLHETAIWDRSLIVVTADHGSSFIPGDFHRRLSERNAGDILAIPLFIKLPNQQVPKIDDRNVELVDVLPTIAEAIGAELPRPVDGKSLFTESERPDEKLVYQARTHRQLSFAEDFPERRAALTRKIDRFGSGTGTDRLFSFGPESALIGRRTADLATATSDSLAVAIDRPPLTPDDGIVPAHIRGHVNGAEAGTALAIAVGGRIVTTTQVLSPTVAAPGTFYAILPENVLGANDPEIEVFVVRRGEHAQTASLVAAAEKTPYRLETDRAHRTIAITANDGRRWPLTGEGWAGRVDLLETNRTGISVAGWAFDRESGSPPTRILVFAHERLLGSMVASGRRTGVVGRFGDAAAGSGFSGHLHAPDQLPRERIAVYALGASTAFRLPGSASGQ